MKIWPLLITGFAALTLAGCQSKPNTVKLNTQLDSAIAAKQYAKAEGINDSIEALNSSDATAKRAKLLHAIVSAQTAIDDAKFSKAITLTKPFTTGSGKLGKKADQLHTQASKLDEQSQSLTDQLNSAKTAHDAGNDAQAVTTLTALLNNKDLAQPELHQLYIKVLKYRLTINQATAATDTNTTATTDNTTANTDDSTTASATNTAPEGQPVSGSENITDADITQARQEIKNLGEDPTYFSNNDVRRAILNARAAGRTHLIASDWK